ncbi:MAG: DUF1722 domain-containing protein [Planctomycetes bacterium]|nr:DUF1722 domain-containing protein [Planctomycetota bacterium]
MNDEALPRGLWDAPDDAPEIRVGISTCLLGRKVRFDGGHKRDAYLTDLLGAFVTFVPVCPEVEIGLGIPREAIRLVSTCEGVRLRGVRSGADHTEKMQRYAAAKVRALEKLDLSGYVLKKDSPSCGMERVKIYSEKAMPERSGAGMFAAALLQHFPLLPVEEEGRLNDPRLRENFLERLFAYRRLKTLFRARWTIGALVRFHTAEKLNLLAHEPEGYRALGRLVAEAKRLPRAEVAARYETLFMGALKKIATVRKNTNVLQHAQGYLKRVLAAADKEELAGLIRDYHRGLVPILVPLTLLRHHVRSNGVEYLAGQTYLEPHPKELMLRNHV